MNRLGNGIGYGIFLVAIALGLFGVGARCGLDVGADQTRREYERQGGGRFIEITLDGREYRGWVR